MPFRLRFFLCCVASAAAMVSVAVPAPEAFAQAKSAKEKSSLQKEQRNIKGQISSIKKDITQKEKRVDNANSALRESEKAISSSNRTLKELGDKKTAVEKQLSDLKRQADAVNMHVNEAEDLVGVISQAQFVNSRRHPWQAAISGKNPNDITRMSAILQYMAREQDLALDRLTNRRKNIEAVTEKTNLTQKELVKIESDEQQNRKKLEQEKSRREVALNELKKELNTQRERYEQLVKNDRQLTNLIASIDKQIAAAQAAAKEKARKEAAARKKAEQERRKKDTAKASGKSSAKDARETVTAPATGNFGKLRGKLTMPTRGQVVARFGQKREGATSDLPWRGLLIRAKQGQNVVATAPGTVVFSDWMRGFGNLLILDHGSNYLSVYANNETLYKSVGQSVKQGETIASVGKSGGEDSPGLYFELRYKGKPFDPARWIAKN